MKNLNLISSRLLFIITLFFFNSCEKDSTSPTLNIPNTYNFENVNYTGQTQRLAMFSEMKNYMATSRTQGVALDVNRLKAMYSNDKTNAQFSGSYEDSKQLRNKTFSNVQADFDALLEELAMTSQSTVEGANGKAGVMKTKDGTKSYLIGDDGLDHAQLIEKGLMGACLYYQATSVYLGVDRMNVDNEIVEAGEGTKMQHHWDEAFGYFGVPKDFPTNKDGLFFWGSYANQRDAVLGSNQKLMDALLKGRTAIVANQLDKRDEAIKEAREQWELIAVGSALHYINDGLANFEDMALRSHSLSEGIGFIYVLQFNEGKKITNTQINELLVLVGGASGFATMNLYNADQTKLQLAKDKLADYYELTDRKDEF
jgi:hypothetical protein